MNSSRPNMITMRTFSEKGRFGNHIFRYAFLKIYATYFNLNIEISPWAGQFLFGHQDPLVTHQLPQITRKELKPTRKLFKSNKPPYVNVDLIGNYHFVNTSFYRPFKGQFRSLFKPTKEVLYSVNPGLAQLRNMGKTIIGIHIRRGDFLQFKNHSFLWVAPTSWYLDWLKRLWPTLKNPVLFIASDDLTHILPAFKAYKPVTSEKLITFSKIIDSSPLDVSFYPDFYLLTQCDYLAISNSTFSFSASMLNKSCKTFMRPDYNNQKLTKYDPWSSNPILKAEKYGGIK